MTRNEHDLHCKAIAETLEKYASGNYFEYDGELYPLDSEDDFWNTENNSFYLDMVACGGPNIYINTWDRRVELFWWDSNGNYDLSRELCDKINDYFREVF